MSPKVTLHGYSRQYRSSFSSSSYFHTILVPLLTVSNPLDQLRIFSNPRPFFPRLSLRNLVLPCLLFLPFSGHLLSLPVFTSRSRHVTGHFRLLPLLIRFFVHSSPINTLPQFFILSCFHKRVSSPVNGGVAHKRNTVPISLRDMCISPITVSTFLRPDAMQLMQVNSSGAPFC